ncbi:hypothetical protein GOODEAATRI_002840 [Goodea atripinnis]|uniref:Uncharacterized protein n=1 Tax=Goodea atripinnis TaxID=208336 RepID=A0ABV0MNX9_9TELE
MRSNSTPSWSHLPHQLTVGLYEFEVTVDGEGAHGQGYVNVTVRPGPVHRCTNGGQGTLHLSGSDASGDHICSPEAYLFLNH